ncbi:hypothetical protein GCM10027190_22670 [Spirosoma areae]
MKWVKRNGYISGNNPVEPIDVKEKREEKNEDTKEKRKEKSYKLILLNGNFDHYINQNRHSYY